MRAFAARTVATRWRQRVAAAAAEEKVGAEVAHETCRSKYYKFQVFMLTAALPQSVCLMLGWVAPAVLAAAVAAAEAVVLWIKSKGHVFCT